jgi:hypothetical protein
VKDEGNRQNDDCDMPRGLFAARQANRRILVVARKSGARSDGFWSWRENLKQEATGYDRGTKI